MIEPDKGREVHGGVRRISHPETTRLDLLGITRDIHLHEFDLGEPINIFRTIRDLKPDEFYNLAAQSFVGSSWDLPAWSASRAGSGGMSTV